MTRPGARAAVAAVALIAGCSSASSEAPNEPASASGLPEGNRHVVDLSDDEALALCEWESERLHYGNCLDDALLLSRSMSCADRLASCTAPDVVASVILGCVAAMLDPALSCDTTVSERLACDLDLERRYDALPSCDRVTDEVIHEILYSMSPPSCTVLRCP